MAEATCHLAVFVPLQRDDGILNLLSTRESTVYELLKQQLKPSEIVRLGFSNSSLYTIIQRLIEMEFVKRGKTAYVPLVLQYEIMHDSKVCSIRQKENSTTKSYLQPPYEKIRISPDVEQYLLKNFSLNRTALANSTGLPRYVINRELMRLQDERGDGASANTN